MPAPTVDWTLVQVRNKYVNFAGDPLEGERVIFTPHATRAVDQDRVTTIIGQPIIAIIAADGTIAVSLPATDDPDITPINFTYRVTEDFDLGQEYDISVPLAAAGTGIELVTIAPQLNPETGTQYGVGPNGDQAPAVNTTGVTGAINNASWAMPSTRTLTLAGNTTLTLNTNPLATVSLTVTLIIKQAASGGPYTFTWPASLEWAGDAAAPSMPVTANAELMVHLFWTGLAWRAFLAGVFYP
jgi:hypothetical protein